MSAPRPASKEAGLESVIETILRLPMSGRDFSAGGGQRDDEPLPRVPALPSNRDALPSAIGEWARSEALVALLDAAGDRLPVDLGTGELLDWLEEYSARWDFRGGRERNLVEAPELTAAVERVVPAVALALGLRGRTAPAGRYDHVLVLGGLVRACLARPLLVAELLREGTVTAGSVTALGGFREIAGNEVGLVERVVGERVDDEFHAMDAGVRNALGVTDPVSEGGESPAVVGAAWCVREYVTEAGLPVRIVAAPSSEPGVRRANTADTYAWFASELAGLEREQRLLIVTSEIYVPYQHADALRMLALPYGVTVDAVGVDPGSVDPDLHQDFDAHHYLQEIRSTVRALRALHGALPAASRPPA